MGKIFKYEDQDNPDVEFVYNDSERFIYVWKKYTTVYEKHHTMPLDFIELGGNVPLSKAEFREKCRAYLKLMYAS